MKHLSKLLGLFFWGVVLNCLREMVAAYPGFTQSLFAWASYALWTAALALILHNMWGGWRHRHEVPTDPEVRHEN